jgi:ATP-dependent helicase HepA
MAVDDGSARVRYFTGPCKSPYVERDHDVSELARAVVSPHTRVYLHDGQRWHIGRIDGTPDGQRRYNIAYPNLKGDRLTDDAFEVRWNVAVDDPFEFLESLGVDSPVVCESRFGFLRGWARQRAAATGVEGLLLGSVELHRHQMAVVRRVAGDPIKRYLLADEVGLGKTIEAAALIWRFLSMNRKGRVLVLVPEHLRHQWAGELMERFRTDQLPGSVLQIRSLADDSRWPTESVDLLVIDEAHLVTRNGPLSPEVRQRIAELAHVADELLLLSATPVRSNEAGFLDLLHLLDPTHYQPNQVEAFTRRVEDRDKLALICQGLVSDIDEFDLSLYAEQLEAEYPEDRLLADLLALATAADDGSRPIAVMRVRQHLSEAYRLHSRVLRTRRSPDVITSFGVRGRARGKPFTVFAEDDTDEQRTQLLDRLRLDLLAATEAGHLNRRSCVEVFREVAQRCGSLSHALLPLRVADSVGQSTAIARLHELVQAGVLTNLDHSIESIHAGHQDRTVQLVDVLTPLTGSKTQSRVVVATAFTEAASAVAAEMIRRWGGARVVTHLKGNSEKDNRDAVERWIKGGDCSILIVDASAEEGVNLQIADSLIHLDLPWESFRIEQRIGRCDRHTPKPMGPIESKVVLFGYQPYAEGWQGFVSDGCDAFTRSLSSLQYVLADTELAVQESVLRDGAAALEDVIGLQKEKLNVEQTRIVAHDALDEVEEQVSTSGGRSVDDWLMKSDQNPALTRNLTMWLEGVGAKLNWEEGPVFRIGKHPRPQVPFDLEAKIAGASAVRLTITRPASVSRRLPILRAGFPMVDAIGTHLLKDDRGVAFAMYRPSPSIWPPEVAFRAEFLVSPSFSDEFLHEAEELGLRAWADQLLLEVSPPAIEKVIAAPSGAEVTEGALIRPYDSRKGDTNLLSRPELFEELTASLDWTALCRNAAERTRELVELRPSVVDRPGPAASQVREAIVRKIDRGVARKLAGLSGGDFGLDRLEALVPGRLEPDLRTLGCGAILVADPSMLGKS